MQQDVRKPREGPRPPARTRAIPTAYQPTNQPAGSSEIPPSVPFNPIRALVAGTALAPLFAAPAGFCDQCAVPLDPKTDTCPQCGVWHGDPCESCGRRGYHLHTCPVLEEGAS